MIYWEKGTTWRCFGWVVAVCVMWTAAAGDLVPIIPAPVVLPGDWPDSAASPPTQPPAQHSSAAARAGAEIVTEMTPMHTVQAASMSSPTVQTPAARDVPSSPPPEEAPKTQATSTSSSSTAPSTTPRLSPSPTDKPVQSTSPESNSSPPAVLDETSAANGVKTGAEHEQAGEEPLCDFDPCVHLQQPCPEVREIKGWSCTCPGLTSDSTTPGSVVALEVTRVWPRAASVRWCAPYSALSAFLIWVLRQDGSAVSNGSVSSWARQSNVFGLEAGHVYSVCVSALNGAGVSHKRCVPVATPHDGEAIALYALTGGCTALLLIAVVLSVCLYRQCRRGQMMGTHTLVNPTMPTLHDPRLTGLVSISNPAYSHSDEQTSAGNTHYTHRAQPKKSTDVNKK